MHALSGEVSGQREEHLVEVAGVLFAGVQCQVCSLVRVDSHNSAIVLSPAAPWRLRGRRDVQLCSLQLFYLF